MRSRACAAVTLASMQGGANCEQLFADGGGLVNDPSHACDRARTSHSHRLDWQGIRVVGWGRLSATGDLP